MSLCLPRNYRNLLGSVENTEKAIKAVKDMFQTNLAACSFLSFQYHFPADVAPGCLDRVENHQEGYFVERTTLKSTFSFGLRSKRKPDRDVPGLGASQL
jgi:hypothetical protein